MPECEWIGCDRIADKFFGGYCLIHRTETKEFVSEGEAIEVGPHGGAGSKIPHWELIDYRALRAIADVFTYGATKYARDNWRAVPFDEHIRHAVDHAYRSIEDQQQYEPETINKTLEELSHFACRAVMALAVYLQEPHVMTRVPKGLACKPKEGN